MVIENSLKVLLSCVFFEDVLCQFRTDVKSGIMARCSDCVHHIRFIHEMDAEDAEFWREIDDIRKKESFSCYCDGKLCDNEVSGACFSTEGQDGDVLRWVCPRFNVNCFSDGALIKNAFLRLHKRGGALV